MDDPPDNMALQISTTESDKFAAQDTDDYHSDHRNNRQYRKIFGHEDFLGSPLLLPDFGPSGGLSLASSLLETEARFSPDYGQLQKLPGVNP